MYKYDHKRLHSIRFHMYFLEGFRSNSMERGMMRETDVTDYYSDKRSAGFTAFIRSRRLLSNEALEEGFSSITKIVIRWLRMK